MGVTIVTLSIPSEVFGGSKACKARAMVSGGEAMESMVVNLLHIGAPKVRYSMLITLIKF